MNIYAVVGGSDEKKILMSKGTSYAQNTVTLATNIKNQHHIM